MGEACYLLSSTGPSKPQQPLKKAAVDGPSQRGTTNSVSVSESDIERPFICLENHWLVHKVCSGVVSTTRQWWRGMGISDFFFSPSFSRHERRILTMSRSSWDSLPFLPQSTKLQKSHWNYQTWPALNIQLGVIWCFSKGFFFFFSPLILIFQTTASLTSRCLFKTPCVRLHWQMLECFCSEWFPQGIVDCPHSSRESLLKVRETKRGHLDEANRQSWRSINRKKVEEKEGGWGREGNMLKSKF